MSGTVLAVPINKIQTNYKSSFSDLKAAANGRWPSILMHHGIPQECFSGKPNEHVNCPFPRHGGAKDFRFDNRNGDGSYICSCSSGKDGFNLLSKYLNIENEDAIKLVSEYLGHNKNQIQFIPQNRAIEEKKPNDDEKPLAKKRAGYHADKIISNCELRPHQYLQDKGIDKPVLVIKTNYKVNDTQAIYAGALIVKVYDVDNPEILIGVQFINLDGQRFYVKDTKIEDGIHIIKGDSSLPYIDVVEGYATGLSTNMATGATTVVAFGVFPHIQPKLAMTMHVA